MQDNTIYLPMNTRPGCEDNFFQCRQMINTINPNPSFGDSDSLTFTNTMEQAII